MEATTELVSKLGDAKTSSHYSHFKIQPIDFIVANDLGFLEANVIKYICRYPYKGSSMKDLEKARQYVDWLIEREKGRAAQGEAAILKALDEIWREGKIGQITEKEKKKLEKAAFLEMQSSCVWLSLQRPKSLRNTSW